MKYGYCKNHSAIYADNAKGLCKKCTAERHARSAESKGLIIKEKTNDKRRNESYPSISGLDESDRRSQLSLEVQKKATNKKTKINHRSEKNKDIIKQELGIFNEIWNESPRICKICQRVLTVFNPILFHHLRTKGSHPELRLEKSNIVLLCDQCHMGEHGFKPKLDREGNFRSS
ncbi:MAG: hypothetical protein WAT92_13225 [Saprospiraceae bacterium]